VLQNTLFFSFSFLSIAPVTKMFHKGVKKIEPESGSIYTLGTKEMILDVKTLLHIYNNLAKVLPRKIPCNPAGYFIYKYGNYSEPCTYKCLCLHKSIYMYMAR